MLSLADDASGFVTALSVPRLKKESSRHDMAMLVHQPSRSQCQVQRLRLRQIAIWSLDCDYLSNQQICWIPTFVHIKYGNMDQFWNGQLSNCQSLFQFSFKFDMLCQPDLKSVISVLASSFRCGVHSVYQCAHRNLTSNKHYSKLHIPWLKNRSHSKKCRMQATYHIHTVAQLSKLLQNQFSNRRAMPRTVLCPAPCHSHKSELKGISIRVPLCSVVRFGGPEVFRFDKNLCYTSTVPVDTLYDSQLPHRQRDDKLSLITSLGKLVVIMLSLCDVVQITVQNDADRYNNETYVLCFKISYLNIVNAMQYSPPYAINSTFSN